MMKWSWFQRPLEGAGGPFSGTRDPVGLTTGGSTGDEGDRDCNH